MAQRISHKWKDEIKSYEANEHLFAMFDAGVLRGFDNYTEEAAGAGLIGFAVAHNGPTGLTKSKQDNTLESNIGMHLTKNGSLVVETAQLTGFTLDVSFSTTNNKRYWLIAEHEYTELVGGSPCTYSVIGGALGTGTTYADPVLPNPEKQVPLLQFDVPVGTVASRTFAAIVNATNVYPNNVVLWQFGFGRTRAELKQNLGFVTSQELIDELAAYYTSTDVDTILNDYYTSVEVDTEISDLYDQIWGDVVSWNAASLHANVIESPSTAPAMTGSKVVSYGLAQNNHVALCGTCTVPDSGTSVGPLFTLPVGFRPATTRFLRQATTGFATYSQYNGLVEIRANGQVYIYQDGSSDVTLSFDGLSFCKND